jgi:hypothetical protein
LVSPVAGGASTFAFIGATAVLSLAPGDKVFAVTSASLSASAPALNVRADVCYSLNGGPVTNAAGAQYITVDIATSRQTISVNGIFSPGPGTATIGMCLMNTSPVVLIGDSMYGSALVLK